MNLEAQSRPFGLWMRREYVKKPQRRDQPTEGWPGLLQRQANVVTGTCGVAQPPPLYESNSIISAGNRTKKAGMAAVRSSIAGNDESACHRGVTDMY